MNTESCPVMPTAAEKFAAITAHFDQGGTIMVLTYTRRTVFYPKHRHMIRLHGTHLEMQSGKQWLCIDFNAIRYSK